MAQLVLTVVGSYFGPIGSAIGSAIGAYIDATVLAPDLPDVVGPRLEDRRVQISAYGTSIPYIFGTVRLAGNVIWSEDLEEVVTETETEAKGGGPTQTTIVYTYFGTFATLLGFGPCRGIRRIWADAVLIYDGTTQGAPPADFDFTFYRGDETQLPDPTMEAALGVGEVPAYRGFSYIVFNRMPLEKFGNRIPSISVEVVGDGEWTIDDTNLSTPAATQPVDGAQRIDGMIVRVQIPTVGTMLLEVVDPTTGEVTLSETHPYLIDFAGHNMVCYVPPTNEVWVKGGPGAYRFNAETLAFIAEVNFFGSGLPQMTYEPTNNNIFARGNAFYVVAGGSAVVLVGQVSDLEILALGVDVDGVHLGSGGYTLEGVEIFESMGAVIDTVPISTLAHACWDGLRHRYVVVDQTQVWTITDENPPVITQYTPTGLSAVNGEVYYDSGADCIVAMGQIVDHVTIAILDAETFEVLAQETPASVVGSWYGFPMPGTPGSMYVQGRYQGWQLDYFGTTVGAAVKRLSLLSDVLEDADVDTAELTQRLRGYLVAQVAPVRTAIEQLALIFFFDGVEQDDQIYYRRRGGAAVATITRDECGAGIDQSADAAIEDVRGQELNLPKRLFINAPDPFTDHQPGTQYAEREARFAGEEETIQTAAVLSATESKRTALTILFDRWASRYGEQFATTRKYARLVPSDPVTVDGRRLRIVSRNDEGGLIRFEAVTDDAEVGAQTATGVQGSFPGQEVAVVVPTTMEMLDIALLRDAEDYPGAYVAAYGIAPQWRGAVIYGSPDDGDSWIRLATMPKPGSAMGYATNALGDWTGGNVFDESNSLSISLNNGEASSTTELGVLNGGNALAIQTVIDTDQTAWEILQYRDAELQGDGTYVLTGLLRGRRGTEYAMSGHAIGDRVVLLSTATIRDFQVDSSVIGVERPVKAVSVGDTISGTPSEDFTLVAERLYPWAPVLLGGGRDASGDLTLNWVRRTRVGGEWRDSVDASLGEDSEEYVVKIFTDSTRNTVARTISGISAQTTPYSAADQTTDHGSPQAPVYWSVQQLSATVGAGHAAHGTT